MSIVELMTDQRTINFILKAHETHVSVYKGRKDGNIKL